MRIREAQEVFAKAIDALEEIRTITENEEDSAAACDQIFKIVDEILWPG